MRCGAMHRSRCPIRSRYSSPTYGGSLKPVASLGSYIRSAARVTFSAYKRVPIRWRLAGGSAALTLVILCGFAVIVGVLTTRRLESEFNRQVSDRASEIADKLELRLTGEPARPVKNTGLRLDDVVAGSN